jgi:uncharacterized cupredoxin-like copper-binding protein
MHAALQLALVLAAEKSKVPYYIAGGLLVLWALTVSLALGLRKPDFPGNLGGQRLVSAITAALVIATLTTAVLTSGTPSKAVAAAPATQAQTTPAEAPPAAGATTATAPPTTSTAATTTAAAPAPPAASKLQIAADPSGLLRFTATSLNTHAGTVTVTMTNSSPVEHNFTIAQGGTVVGATPTFTSGTRTLTVRLAPGKYTFYCSVPGHRQAGMEGTLTVQ